MTLEMYVNTSERERLDKNLTPLGTFQGNLESETDLLNPIFVIEGNLANVWNLNYIHVPEFGRYYFVEDISSITNNLYKIVCKVDVLSTYKEAIRAHTAIVDRSESPAAYNMNLNDGSIKAYQNPHVLTTPFPHGFDGNCFILTVAG